MGDPCSRTFVLFYPPQNSVHERTFSNVPGFHSTESASGNSYRTEYATVQFLTLPLHLHDSQEFELLARYWAYVQAHPNHISLHPDALQEAKKVILWSYAGTLFLLEVLHEY